MTNSEKHGGKSAAGEGKSSQTELQFRFYRGPETQAWSLATPKEGFDTFDAIADKRITPKVVLASIMAQDEQAVLHLDMLYCPDVAWYESAKKGKKRVPAKLVYDWLAAGNKLVLAKDKRYGKVQLQTPDATKQGAKTLSMDDIVFE